jgi:hypothetical protein
MSEQMLLDELKNLHLEIHSTDPAPSNENERQAELTIRSFQQTVNSLIMSDIPIKIIFMSLFYFWFKLEADMQRVSDTKINAKLKNPDVLLKETIALIKSIVDSYEDNLQSSQMQTLGQNIDMLKLLITDDMIDCKLPYDELKEKTEKVNLCIVGVIKGFLDQSYNPEIIANVLFNNWLRFSAFNSSITEKYYQKIEYYFEEVTVALRAHIFKVDNQ